jgi:hypothetical protein
MRDYISIRRRLWGRIPEATTEVDGLPSFFSLPWRNRVTDRTAAENAIATSARSFGVTVSQIKEMRKRDPRAMESRRVAIRKLLGIGLSLSVTGRLVGGRHHSTIVRINKPPSGRALLKPKSKFGSVSIYLR